MPALAFAAALLALPLWADYTVHVNPGERRGVWEGWGTSLAWWANAAGGTEYQDLYADLFFTQGSVSFMDRSLPGLGMNIVRYNVGGGGRAGDIPGLEEARSPDPEWYKHVEGFWLDWNSKNPASSSWDFGRDAAQRAVLSAALQRGVDAVELFSNSPMWWMKDSKSADGGRLQSWNIPDHARYLAAVAEHARSEWGADRLTVEPFNEPSEEWWKFPAKQEGATMPLATQSKVLRALRRRLDRSGLGGVPIAASDENTVTRALYTVEGLRLAGAGGAVGKLNVHGYNGLEPGRDNGARGRLRLSAGEERVWMSEYGDGDASGMALAQSITEDLSFLRPTAWIYWQALEPNHWGLVTGELGSGPQDPRRGRPKDVNRKYYVMAQFSRFVRPGHQLLDNDDHNTVAAYDPHARTLAFVTVNYGNPQAIVFDLSSFSAVGPEAEVTITNTAGPRVFESATASVIDRRVMIEAEADTVYSVLVKGAER